MKRSDKPRQGYLVDTITGERLTFPINPAEITDDKAAAYANIKVPGLSHPRYQFIAGEARRISFKLELFKGPVKQQVNWLRSLLYPERSGALLKCAPHRVLFFFGTVYPGVPCIVTQVKVRYFGLFESSLLPQRAEVEITLEEYREQSVNYKTIRGR